MKKTSQPRPEILTITDRALMRIKSILKDAPKDTIGVRFGVKTGGAQV